MFEKYDEDIDGNEMAYNTTLHDYGRAWRSCTLYEMLLTIAFTIIMSSSGACFGFYWYSRREKA